jgi:hypothetical protein
MKRFDVKVVTFTGRDHLERQVCEKVEERQRTDEVLEVVITDLKPMTDDVARVLGVGHSDIGFASVMIVYE